MKSRFKPGDIICSYSLPYFYPRYVLSDNSDSNFYYVENPHGASYNLYIYNDCYSYNTVHMSDINYHRISYDLIVNQLFRGRNEKST